MTEREQIEWQKQVIREEIEDEEMINYLSEKE